MQIQSIVRAGALLILRLSSMQPVRISLSMLSGLFLSRWPNERELLASTNADRDRKIVNTIFLKKQVRSSIFVLLGAKQLLPR